MQPDNNEKSVITLIHSSWGSRGNERSALVVNLNADLLYADLFEGQEEAYSQNNRYVLFSPGYGLLLGKTEDAEEIRRMAERFEGDDGVNVYEEEDLIVMRTSSQLLNWELFNVRSFERYHASMKYLQWSLMAAHGSMIVLTLIVSIVFIRKLYQPIRWLIRYIENGEKSGKQVRMHGEMKLIASTLLNSVHKALKLQQTLEESMPAYREKFVLSLIRGSELPPDEVRRKFTFLGIPLRPDNVVPIVLLARRHQADREDPILEMTKSLDLQDIVQAKAAEAGAALVVSLDDEKLLLLVNTEQENMLGVYHLLQSIRRHVWDSISVSLIIGVGAHCRYVHEWPKAFQEAEEALRFGILHGKEDIYSIYDVQVGRPASGNELHVDEESILNGIRGGDVVKTGEAFRMFLQDISRSNPEKRELQHLLIRLLGKIIVASDQIGLRSHLLDRENLKVLDILYWGTEQEMTDWFERFVAALAAETSSLMNEKDNKHIEYIERRLQEDMTLNLDTLSRELNMNPAYLSRIFKEKINENFIDYFTRIKIEKSKELLERTETKVKEIAKMLGYESSSYFSAVFKKHTGCTPNQYRVLRKSR